MSLQLKEMIADVVDRDKRLRESELFIQQMQKVCWHTQQCQVSSMIHAMIAVLMYQSSY